MVVKVTKSSLFQWYLIQIAFESIHFNVQKVLLQYVALTMIANIPRVPVCLGLHMTYQVMRTHHLGGKIDSMTACI